MLRNDVTSETEFLRNLNISKGNNAEDVLLSFHLFQIVVGVRSVFGTPFARSVSIVIYEAQPETKARAFGFAFVHSVHGEELRTMRRSVLVVAKRANLDSTV